ncbi:MAG: hypothetical protein AAF485_09610, partial [Chloroflexota bacterium]
DRVAEMIIPNAPSQWQDDYRRLLSEEMPYQVDKVDVEVLEFDGTCALAEVALDDHPQLRTYCLTNQQWRRGPVASTLWGGAPQTINLTNGLTLTFFERDQAFAEQLATDLETFFQTLEAWQITSGTPFTTLEIKLEAQDLRQPLLGETNNQIRLNSPWLVPFDGVISPEMSVRLALGELLLARLSPKTAWESNNLPGGERFLDATHQILALHLLSSLTTRAVMQNQWRQALADEWHSPFFTGLGETFNYAAQANAEVAALFTADYIAQRQGIESLARIMIQVPRIKGWDTLFEAILDRPAVTLEAEAEIYARQWLQAIPDSQPPLTSSIWPINVTLTPFSDENTTQLYAQRPEQNQLTVIDVTPDTTVVDTQGDPLAIGCLSAGQDIAIEGQWLEQTRRLEATQLIAQNLAPPTIDLADGNILAYFLTGVPTEAQGLVAIQTNGDTQTLIEAEPALQIMALPMATDQSPHFLITRELPECRRDLVMRYDPKQGVTDIMFSPPGASQTLWRPEHEDFLFIVGWAGSEAYDIYQSNQTSFPDLLISPTLAAPSFIMGWHEASQQLLTTRTWIGETFMSLFDLEGAKITPLMRPRYQPPRLRRLNPQGTKLAYLAGVQNFIGPPDTLDILDLTGEQPPQLFQVAFSEGLGAPVWSQYLDQSAIALISGPMDSEDRLHPSRILRLDLDAPRPALTLVTQAIGQETFADPVFCGNGSLLYTVQQGDIYQLRLQPLNLRARTIVEQSGFLQPLACP